MIKKLYYFGLTFLLTNFFYWSALLTNFFYWSAAMESKESNLIEKEISTFKNYQVLITNSYKNKENAKDDFQVHQYEQIINALGQLKKDSHNISQQKLSKIIEEIKDKYDPQDTDF